MTLKLSHAARWRLLTAIIVIAAFTAASAFAAIELTEKDLADIAAINKSIAAKKQSWTAGPTSVLNRPGYELCGTTQVPAEAAFADAGSAPPTTNQSRPAFWDWRNKDGHNWTTSVKDQQGCGSCYIFAACAAIEHCMKVQSGPDGWLGNPNLSEQYLLSCFSQYTCVGGRAYFVMETVRDYGTPDDACFPYTGFDTTPCSNACPDFQSRLIKIHQPFFALIGNQPDLIKDAIMTYGGVSVAFTVYADFRAYSGGVYEHTWGDVVGGHGVALVGWDDSQQCWIAKNSWGTNWGETKDFQPFTWGAGDGGWFRMKYDIPWAGVAYPITLGLPNIPAADLTGARLSGWTRQLMPRTNSDTTSSYCPAPTVLPGGTTSTFINYAGRNVGSRRSLPFDCKTFVDNKALFTAYFGALDPTQLFANMNAGPFKISGGRHTIKTIIDYSDTVFETDESIYEPPHSNLICGQFVWSPSILNSATSFYAPPPPRGVSDCPEAIWPDCYGLGFDAVNSPTQGRWTVLAALSTGSAKYEMGLYDRGSYQGAFKGFDTNRLAVSGSPSDPCAFVLVNTRNSPAGTYYAGISSILQNEDDCCIDFKRSKTITAHNRSDWDEVHTLDDGEVVDVYEIYLTPGEYSFNLRHRGGSAALGLSLFHCGLAAANAEARLKKTSANIPTSVDFSYNITTAGYYGLVVFKSRSADHNKRAFYSIMVGTPGLYVREPNGGEKMGIGEWHSISFYRLGMYDPCFLYVRRSGTEPWSLLTTVYSSNSEYRWHVVGPVSNYCMVKVSDRYDDSISDVSDGVFSIISRTIDVHGPDAGQILVQEQPYSLSWSSTNVDGNVRVLLSQDTGGHWTPLGDEWPNNGSMLWYVQAPASTNCRIKVESVDYPGCYSLNEGKFTISGPSITVTSPNPDNIWLVGDAAEITWDSLGIYGNVNIDISRDDGGSWQRIISGTPNDGSQSWIVTDPVSEFCKIRVTSVNTNYVYGVSTGRFKIRKRILEVTHPAPGDIVEIPNALEVNWEGYPSDGNVKLELSRDNGATWTTIADSVPNSQMSYTWTPTTPPDSTECLIRVSNVDNPSAFGVSPGPFTIGGSWIEVLRPNGGERIFAQEPCEMSWISGNVTGFLLAEESRDGGETWSTLNGMVPPNGTYMWTPPPGNSNQCRIRLSSYDVPGIEDISDGDFTIDSREIYVMSPSEGESLCPGSTKEIYWVTKDVGGTVSIEFSPDDGNSWTKIADGILAKESFFWEVNTQVSQDCLIRVSSDHYPAVGVSKPFVIHETGVSVTHPNGNESFTVGRPYDITWTRCGSADYVDIELTRDDGETWTTIFANTPNDGIERWVPTGTYTRDARIRVTPVGQPQFADMSDRPFEICERYITVLSPNGGEKWSITRPVTIEWRPFNAERVKIELSRDRGYNWEVIAEECDGVTSYDWTVTGPGSNQCLVRVTSTEHHGVSGQSDAGFTILSDYLNITAPDGGETLTVGADSEITWLTSGVSDTLAIKLSRDLGKTWEPLFDSVPNSGSKSWTVTGPDSATCLLLLMGETSGIRDRSEAPFTILTRTITVTSPTASAVWGIGEEKTLTWDSARIDGKVSIQVSRNGGAYTTIASGIDNTGSFTWTVTSPAANNCRMRVVSDNYPSVFGTSGPISIRSMVTVPCDVTLQDWVASPAGHEVTVRLFEPFGRIPIETRTFILDADGKGEFLTAHSGTHTLNFKTSHWLDQSAADVNIADGMSSVNVSLRNGDCNEDNTVDSADIDILKDSWSMYPAVAGNADLNGDGRCDVFDLQIIRKNWSAGGVQLPGTGTVTMWFGDESGNVIDTVRTLVGEPFDVYVWAATSGSTWFINAAVGFNSSLSEGPTAYPKERKIELLNDDPDVDIVWGDATTSYPIELQKELVGFYSQTGGSRPYGASFGLASIPDNIAAFNRLCIGKVSLYHRMSAGKYTTISLWDDGSGSAGGLSSMAFGRSAQYSPASNLTVISYIASTIPEAKASPNGDEVLLAPVPVTARFREFFYVEAPDRSIGIRVVGSAPGLQVGNLVEISGDMHTDESGERYIQAELVTILGTNPVEPVSMTCKNLGGSDWKYDDISGAGQIGIANAAGLNNIGLLVRIFGRCQRIDDNTMWLDDGSGVPVICAMPENVTVGENWEYATVTGISSIIDSDGAQRLIRVRSANDIALFSEPGQ